MATNKSPIFQNTVSMINENITDTSAHVMFTAGSDGGIVNRLTAVNLDSTAEELKVEISDGTDTVVIGVIAIPASAGFVAGTPSVNLLDSGLMPGLLQDDGSLVLGPSCTLQVTSTSALTGVDVTCLGGSYSA